MKRSILLTIMLCGLMAFSFAQNSSSPKFGVALETGLPVGDAEDVYSVGLGGSAKLEIPVTSPFAVTLSAGYLNMQVKDDLQPVLGESREFIPIKAGAKYYFGRNFFGEGELGASIPTESSDETAFAYAPGIGVTLPVADQTAIDIGLRYEGWTRDQGDIDQVGLRAVIKF